MIFTGALLAYALLEGSMFLVASVLNAVRPYSIPTRAALFERQAEWLEWLVEEAGREETDPLLGWRYRRSYAAGPDTINAAGLRATREYSDRPSEPRVAAFGDSFVYCSEVSNGDCWTAMLETGWSVEVPNFGVGGYGTDQAFLRYLEEGRALHPDIVVIGFAPVDLRRIVNRYRRFVTHDEGPWFKPRFVFSGEGLELLPTPVGSPEEALALIDDPSRIREVGEGDAWYEPAVYEHWAYGLSPTFRVVTYLRTRLRRRYSSSLALLDEGVFRDDTEAFRLQTAVIETFADSVRADGARPVVLMLPSLDDVVGAGEGRRPVYDPLTVELRDRGLEVIDPVEAMGAAEGAASELFAPGGHHSAAGGRVIASSVATWLRLPSR